MQSLKIRAGNCDIPGESPDDNFWSVVICNRNWCPCALSWALRGHMSVSMAQFACYIQVPDRWESVFTLLLRSAAVIRLFAICALGHLVSHPWMQLLAFHCWPLQYLECRIANLLRKLSFWLETLVWLHSVAELPSGPRVQEQLGQAVNVAVKVKLKLISESWSVLTSR